MHYGKISNNYAWYPWNTDPENNPTPPEYEGMAVQPLGDRQAAYDEMINGCVEFYKEKGFRCREYEADRVRMSLRQAQSMEVSSYVSLHTASLRCVGSSDQRYGSPLVT